MFVPPRSRVLCTLAFAATSMFSLAACQGDMGPTWSGWCRWPPRTGWARWTDRPHRPTGATNNGRPIYGPDGANGLIAFGAQRPDIVHRRVTVSGLAAGESLQGIDFGPVDGRLYALGSTSRVYIAGYAYGRTWPLARRHLLPHLRERRLALTSIRCPIASACTASPRRISGWCRRFWWRY